MFKKLLLVLALFMPFLSIADDSSAVTEIKKIEWVKDVFANSGYMNIGVIRSEKDWTSPMIAKLACGIMKRHNSGLNLLRFVDIEQVVYQKQTPRDAEISKFSCRDLV